MNILIFLLFISIPTRLLAMESSLEERKALRSPVITLLMPDEILVNIFLNLNKKDIPSVSRVNQKFNMVMNNNRLWNLYAEKAFIITNGQKYDEGKNYKGLVKEHFIPSFTILKGGEEESIGNCSVLGISADGENIVGYATDNVHRCPRAFRWTKQRGIEFLPGLGEQVGCSCANSISPDGLIVGYVNDTSFVNNEFPIGKQTACLWAKDGIKALPLNLGPLSHAEILASKATGISIDEAVIVGGVRYILHGHERRGAFRLSMKEEKTLDLLGVMSGGTYIEPISVSANGSVIIGFGDRVITNRQTLAFYWTKEEGIQLLGTLNQGTQSRAHGTNFDGSVIVGYSADGSVRNDSRAFCWTKKTGMKVLGPVHQEEQNTPYGIIAYGRSFDGLRVIGLTNYALKPFLWEHGKGIQFVEQVLHDSGIPQSLTNKWELEGYSVISASGTVLAGTAKPKDGSFSSRVIVGWRAVIPKDNFFSIYW